MTRKISGFTLLEMSVVILIIALLAAGVVTGKTLIREAGLRAVLAEQDSLLKATREFMDKYQALPGDMKNAETLWGSMAGATCGTLAYSANRPTDTLTCDGDGNGRIASCVDDLTCSNHGEAWWAWQHLANAGLIEGRYTGLAGGTVSTYQAKVGLNVPKSRLTPGGWTLIHYINLSDQSWAVGDQYGHILMFGGDKGAQSGKFTTQPIIPSMEAYSLDLKIDDGIPISGYMRAWDDYWMPTSDAGPTAGAGDASASCISAGAYFNGNDEKTDLCSVFFIPGF